MSMITGSEVARDAAAARQRVLDVYRTHVSAGLACLAGLMHAGVEARSSGAYVWDEAGERYLDCGGYGVFILGHCHPRVVNAVVDQVRSHPLTTQLLLNRGLAEAAEALARVAPEGLDHVYFGVSGADAVETALKLARLNGRTRVIAMDNGYHGMTLGALSVTGRAAYRDPFQPLPGPVEFVPFGDVAALTTALEGGPTACVLLEPVQAEAGVVVPPAGYLKSVERACRGHNAFLVLDEIQTGLGRLGAWWGAGLEDVVPDLLLAGKSLSGGVVPVSAVVGTKAAFDQLSRNPLIHSATFAGAPIAMAAARAAIEAIEDEDIITRARVLGAKLHGVVETAVHDACPSLVREVRASGLLVGIEWEADFLALDFLIEMLDRRVILSHSMNAPRVTRFTPPAVLSDGDLDVIAAAARASGAAMAAR
jgi:putrescine aminotransferase